MAREADDHPEGARGPNADLHPDELVAQGVAPCAPGRAERGDTSRAHARMVRCRLWLRTSFGVGHPTSPHHVYDCMLDHRAEPCTRGAPYAAYSAIKFADAVPGLAAESRLTAAVG